MQSIIAADDERCRANPDALVESGDKPRCLPNPTPGILPQAGLVENCASVRTAKTQPPRP